MLTYIRFIFSLLLCLLSTLLHSAETARFEYDALGRRTLKETHDTCHRYAWDGNVVLHEWDVDEAGKPKIVTDATGREEYSGTEKPENLVTWVYDGTSFTPVAKVADGERYTIVQDYLGTPTQAYDSRGKLVWEMLLDMYGKVTECHGDSSIIPFRYQGQYEDSETGLYYNRYRYYDPSTGCYISQDPIRLLSGESNFYAYVKDTNMWLDIFGLSATHLHHTIPREVYNPRSGKPAMLPEHLVNDPDIKGRAGNPNRWSIPADEHIALHKKNRPGGDYNTRWKQELDLLDPDKSKWTKQDILDIRDKLTKEFGIDKYKPKCKK